MFMQVSHCSAPSAAALEPPKPGPVHTFSTGVKPLTRDVLSITSCACACRSLAVLFPRLRHLSHLTLDLCTGLCDEALSCLAAAPGLTAADVRGCWQITNEGACRCLTKCLTICLTHCWTWWFSICLTTAVHVGPSLYSMVWEGGRGLQARNDNLQGKFNLVTDVWCVSVLLLQVCMRCCCPVHRFSNST
jgi:hypothetical protein